MLPDYLSYSLRHAPTYQTHKSRVDLDRGRVTSRSSPIGPNLGLAAEPGRRRGPAEFKLDQPVVWYVSIFICPPGSQQQQTPCLRPRYVFKLVFVCVCLHARETISSGSSDAGAARPGRRPALSRRWPASFWPVACNFIWFNGCAVLARPEGPGRFRYRCLSGNARRTPVCGPVRLFTPGARARAGWQ